MRGESSVRKSLLIARVVSVNRKPGLQQRVRTGGGIRGVRRDWDINLRQKF